MPGEMVPQQHGWQSCSMACTIIGNRQLTHVWDQFCQGEHARNRCSSIADNICRGVCEHAAGAAAGCFHLALQAALHTAPQV